MSSLSADNALPARVLQLRARLALGGQADDVLADVQGETAPELVAVGALAEQALGHTDRAVAAIEGLAKGDAGDNATVQVLGGTVLAAAGKAEEALALLGRHQGSCESFLFLLPFRGRRRGWGWGWDGNEKADMMVICVAH